MQGAMPDMFVAIRISKDHFGRTEMKDWVFKALIDEITIHFANYSNSPSFPEFSIGLCSVIWKFKKDCKNGIYCKILQTLLGWVTESVEKIQTLWAGSATAIEDFNEENSLIIEKKNIFKWRKNNEIQKLSDLLKSAEE